MNFKTFQIYKYMFRLQRHSTDGEDQENKGLKLQDLPDDCIRSILRRLSNHEDILNTSKALNPADERQLSEEQHLWRELCIFHFTDEQTQSIRAKQSDQNNWQTIYYRLKR